MESELKLKPCRNCGSSNLHHRKLSKSRDVECNDCSELLPEEEWQADNAREKLLRVKHSERLRKLNRVACRRGRAQEKRVGDDCLLQRV